MKKIKYLILILILFKNSKNSDSSIKFKDNKLNIGTILLLSLVGISVCGMIGGIIYTLYKKNK